MKTDNTSDTLTSWQPPRHVSDKHDTISLLSYLDLATRPTLSLNPQTHFSFTTLTLKQDVHGPTHLLQLRPRPTQSARSSQPVHQRRFLSAFLFSPPFPTPHCCIPPNHPNPHQTNPLCSSHNRSRPSPPPRNPLPLSLPRGPQSLHPATTSRPFARRAVLEEPARVQGVCHR